MWKRKSSNYMKISSCLMKSEKITEKLTKAKDRILKKIRCGLSTYEETNMPYSESYFFRYKFVSKALLVERTRLEVIRTL